MRCSTGLLALMLTSMLTSSALAQPTIGFPAPQTPPSALAEDAPAEQPAWIQVELIVFRQLDTSSAGNERWPENPRLSYPQPLRFLEDAATSTGNGTPPADPDLATGPRPFELLGPDERLLRDAASRIANSAGYRLLQHLAWRQPAAAGSPVHLLVTGGTALGEHHELEGSVTLGGGSHVRATVRLWLNDFATAADEQTAGVVLPDVPQPPRALADDLDASLASPPEDATPIEVEPLRVARSVPLNATRELAWGKLNYIDHPLFGVLLMAAPFDAATPSTPASDTATVPEESARGE